MKSNNRRVKPAAVLIGMMLFFTVAGEGKTATLHVANNGEDSEVCGLESSPCLSIGRAIAHAAAGDVIIVGPGRYGDLNGNGILGEPGEEMSQPDCSCMIRIDRRLTLQSRDGTGATVLDAGRAKVGEFPFNVVRIEANDVVFGNKNRGFTLARGNVGLLIFGADRVRVQWNLAVGNALDGFFVVGDANMLSNNMATANGASGFFIDGDDNELNGNLASVNESDGFGVFNNAHQNVFRDNMAIANRLRGFVIAGSDHELRRNAAVRNRGFGIHLLTNLVSLHQNNIYGNNEVPFPLDGLTNCGLRVSAAGALDVTDNFWGNGGGPGSNPADTICAIPGADVDSEPFARGELGVKGGV